MQDDHSQFVCLFHIYNWSVFKLLNDWFDIYYQTGIIYNISSYWKISCSKLYIHVVILSHDLYKKKINSYKPLPKFKLCFSGVDFIDVVLHVIEII